MFYKTIEKGTSEKDESIHLISLLASNLFLQDNLISNRHIGSSFLCCIYCSIFLDCHSFEFRGTSEEFESSRQILSLCECRCQNSGCCFKKFLNDITMLKDTMQNVASQPPFIGVFRNVHPIHNCTRTSKKLSDYLSLYMKFYEQ